MVCWFLYRGVLINVWGILYLQRCNLWYRTVEPKQDSGLGLGYHQLRMVGWYRSRRNTYLSNLIIVSSGLENRC